MQDGAEEQDGRRRAASIAPPAQCGEARSQLDQAAAPASLWLVLGELLRNASGEEMGARGCYVCRSSLAPTTRITDDLFASGSD